MSGARAARVPKEEEFWLQFGGRAKDFATKLFAKKMPKLQLNKIFGDSHFNETLLFPMFLHAAAQRADIYNVFQLFAKAYVSTNVHKTLFFQ